MRAFIYANFVGYLLWIVVYATDIATETYPRIEKHFIGRDVFKLIVSFGWAIWAAYLLFIL